MSTPNRPRTRSSSITRSRSLGRAAKISSAAPSHPAIPPPSVEQDIEYINSFLPPTLPDIEESLEEPPSQDIEESLEESPSQGLTKATLSTIYKPSEIASLTTSYTRLRASTNHWPVLRHSNSAAIRMKRGSLGNNSRIWGSATGEINCTPKVRSGERRGGRGDIGNETLAARPLFISSSPPLHRQLALSSPPARPLFITSESPA